MNGKWVPMLLVLGGWATESSKSPTTETDFITFSNIEKAWQYGMGENTKVAVLDWLFDMSDEARAKYVNAISLVPGQEIGDGKPWHGEWMAEIVHRVAPEAKIVPIRARPGKGKQSGDKCLEQPYERYLIQGIRYAADQGAVAVTNSMGPVKHSAELDAAVAYAADKGTVFINVHPEYLVYTKEEFRACDSDQCNESIIHTGLVSVPEHPTEPQPNRDIYVWPYKMDPVYKDGWGFSNGPPIVGGVVALMKSLNPQLTPKDIKQIIIATADQRSGFKVLNAHAAVGEALNRCNSTTINATD